MDVAASNVGGHDLVPVHGGLAEPVDRVVPLRERKALLAEALRLPALRVARADLSTLHRIADGTLSPLEGPMGADAWHRVLDEGVVLAGGGRYAWGIPLAFPATDAEAAALGRGGSAALRDEDGAVVGVLDEIEVFDWDKPKYVRQVYGTERFDHPGGRMTEADERRKLVGGRLRALPQEAHPEWSEYLFSPRLSRAFLRERKWQRALAFQTRNPLHRAHEYALVAGVERLTREGFFTGVVLMPLVGELKGDDVPAAVRMRCYRALHDLRLLGDGDKDEALWESVGYDLSEVFEVIALDIRMFYGGPKEAIMHAIYRQNHGFTDLVIGRKHADAPYDDGSPIWGDFDAQHVFDALPGELRIRPCKIGFAAYYESIGRIDLTDNHPGQKPFAISGTKVREQLQRGEKPDPRILRPEIAEILIAAYRS
jgi:sulfate adenylyltransferase